VTHPDTEGHTATLNVADHPARADSPIYVRSRKTMNAIAATLADPPFGPGPWQDHHGAGILLHDGDGWFLTLGPLGIEWSAQWCADPAKVDRLCRKPVQRLVDRFPETLVELSELGYHDGERVLETPIVDQATLGEWVDSIWNASVPIPAALHTGVLPHGAGYHQYPKPIVDIQMFKRDDFDLWVKASDGTHVAVAPVAPRGSGDGQVQVLYARHGTEIAAELHGAHAAGKPLVLPADHPLATAAFAQQAA